MGAPKSGTTAMNDYLAGHPDIFMIEKELHFFGKDLKVRERIKEADYLEKFSAAGAKKIRGEASVWYLYSESAAYEIKSFAPAAKILIMLRNPVDVIYSLHSQHLYDGNEVITEFEAAIALDDERRKGERLPDSVDYFALPPYRDTVLFSRQVKRYFDVFGRDHVHVVLYDDFKANTKETVSETLSFLGVDPAVEVDTRIINANKAIKYFYLHRLLRKPPAFMKKLVRFVLPDRELRHRIMKKLFALNIKVERREKLDEGIRGKLKAELADEVYLLGELIKRDLSGWMS